MISYHRRHRESCWEMKDTCMHECKANNSYNIDEQWKNARSICNEISLARSLFQMYWMKTIHPAVRWALHYAEGFATTYRAR